MLDLKDLEKAGGYSFVHKHCDYENSPPYYRANEESMSKVEGEHFHGANIDRRIEENAHSEAFEKMFYYFVLAFPLLRTNPLDSLRAINIAKSMYRLA